jgi:hypothetical protein
MGCDKLTRNEAATIFTLFMYVTIVCHNWQLRGPRFCACPCGGRQCSERAVVASVGYRREVGQRAPRAPGPMDPQLSRGLGLRLPTCPTACPSARLPQLGTVPPRPALVYCVWLSDVALRGPGPSSCLFPWGPGPQPVILVPIPKQPNGTPGKKVAGAIGQGPAGLGGRGRVQSWRKSRAKDGKADNFWAYNHRVRLAGRGRYGALTSR